MILYYVLLIVGSIPYCSLLKYVPLWTWIVPRIMIMIVGAWAVGITSYIIAFWIIYPRDCVLWVEMNRVLTPLKIIMGWSLILTPILLITGKFTWAQFTDAMIHFVSWCFVIMTSESLTARINRRIESNSRS